MSGVLWPRLCPAVPALALSGVVLALVFHTEIAAAVHVWDSSTAYGHCWLVLPIAIFLLHDRAGQAAAAVLRPRAAWALLGLPFVLLWLMADLLGVMEGRQLALFGFVQALLLAAFGARLWTAMSAGLLYLVFLVPFGAFVTPALQGFTVAFIEHGLDLLGIANRVSGNDIEIPEGVFYVAEACAGLRFLIASVAFGVLYALTMFTSPRRRLVFVAASCVVPVIANGFRALGIVVLGHMLGSAQAAAADHLLYGWVFFSIVIALLAVSGLPFRQDAARPPPPAAPPAPAMAMRVIYAVWPALLVAAAGPALAMALTAGGAPAPRAMPVLLAPAGCRLVATEMQGGSVSQDFACGDTRLTSRLFLPPPRASPSRVLMLAQGLPETLLPGADLDGGRLSVPDAQPDAWMLASDPAARQAAAYVLLIDGVPSLGGLRDRWRLARGMVLGAPRTVAVLAVAVTRTHAEPVATLRAFLSAQGDLVERLTAGRPTL